MTRTVLTLALTLLIAIPLALADGGGGAGTFKVKDGDGKKDESEKKEEAKGTLVQRLLAELKTLVERERVKPDSDADLLDDIEKLVKSFEKRVKPVKLEDLTEEDRVRLKEEVRKEIEEEGGEGDGDGRDGGRVDWQARAVERALEDVRLKDEEREEVTGFLTEFAKDVGAAYREQDYKLVGDLKDDLEKKLTRKLGRNRAKDIMNNVNRQFGGRGRGWGR